MHAQTIPNGQISQNGGGRPRVILPYVVKKLEEALLSGLSIETACQYATISKQTYYNYYESDEVFRRKMDSARAYLTLVAANRITTAILKEKDTATARWYLERKEKSVFGRDEKNEQQDINIVITDTAHDETNKIIKDTSYSMQTRLLER